MSSPLALLGQIQLIDPALVRGLSYVILFLLVAPLFPFVYVVLRWRLQGEERRGVGSYGALLYFRTSALLLALAGAANLSYGAISTTPVDEELTRLSWGLFVGSLVFLAINVALGRLFDLAGAARHVRRVFAGFLMVMAGLVSAFVLIVFFITAFENLDAADAGAAARHADDLKLYGAWTFYYLATYLIVTWILARKTAE